MASCIRILFRAGFVFRACVCRYAIMPIILKKSNAPKLVRALKLIQPKHQLKNVGEDGEAESEAPVRVDRWSVG